MYRFNKKAKTDRPPLQSTRLLDHLRERIRYLHYSLRTEKTYVYWVRLFVRWHKLRHPSGMGKAEVEAFLMWLANKREVSPSTHRQALSALLFLYKEVLSIELPWLDEVGHPKSRERLPSVLSRDEVERIFSFAINLLKPVSAVTCGQVKQCPPLYAKTPSSRTAFFHH